MGHGENSSGRSCRPASLRAATAAFTRMERNLLDAMRVARNVLTRYHPLEPEMWLHLADGRQFPQCIYGGSMVAIVAPSNLVKTPTVPFFAFTNEKRPELMANGVKMTDVGKETKKRSPKKKLRRKSDPDGTVTMAAGVAAAVAE